MEFHHIHAFGFLNSTYNFIGIPPRDFAMNYFLSYIRHSLENIPIAKNTECWNFNPFFIPPIEMSDLYYYFFSDVFEYDKSQLLMN